MSRVGRIADTGFPAQPTKRSLTPLSMGLLDSRSRRSMRHQRRWKAGQGRQGGDVETRVTSLSGVVRMVAVNTGHQRNSALQH
jgi:hypothetical protein